MLTQNFLCTKNTKIVPVLLINHKNISQKEKITHLRVRPVREAHVMYRAERCRLSLFSSPWSYKYTFENRQSGSIISSAWVTPECGKYKSHSNSAPEARVMHPARTLRPFFQPLLCTSSSLSNLNCHPLISLEWCFSVSRGVYFLERRVNRVYFSMVREWRVRPSGMCVLSVSSGPWVSRLERDCLAWRVLSRVPLESRVREARGTRAGLDHHAVGMFFYFSSASSGAWVSRVARECLAWLSSVARTVSSGAWFACTFQWRVSVSSSALHVARHWRVKQREKFQQAQSFLNFLRCIIFSMLSPLKQKCSLLWESSRKHELSSRCMSPRGETRSFWVLLGPLT